MRQKLHLAMLKPKEFGGEALKYMLLSKSRCVVTDAHALVIHNPLEIFDEDFWVKIPDGEWLVPYDAVEMMSKKNAAYYIEDKNIYVIVNGKKSAFGILENNVAFKYPAVDNVIPKEFTFESNSICVNPALLNNLRQAIDPDMPGVLLEFSGEERAMKVTVPKTDVKEYIAIIMPMLKY